MRFRRALFLAEPGQDPDQPLGVLRHVAPELEHLLVVEPLPAPISTWLLGEHSRERDLRTSASLERLRELAATMAPSVDVQFAPELRPEALGALCTAEDIDLLVLGSRSVRTAAVLPAQHRRAPVAILWTGPTRGPGPIRHIGCVALDRSSRAAIAAFLRDHADPSLHVTLLSLAGPSPEALGASLEVSGIHAEVEVPNLRDAASVRLWLEEWRSQAPLDLLVFVGAPGALASSARRLAPVLLLPPAAAPRPPQRPIDLADVVDDGRAIRVRVDHVAAVGNLAPVPDQALAFVSGGRVLTTVTTSGGEAELPTGLAVSSLGVYRIESGVEADPLAAIERRVTVLHPGGRPLVLFDAELPDDALRSLAASTAPSAPEPLAIRLRPTRSARSIRQRLRATGLPARVLDARAVLDEGDALDVSAALDPVRLARVASTLRRGGFEVTALVHRGPVVPPPVEEASLRGGGVLEAVSAPASGAISSPPVGGNRIEIELDNATARRWLLELIQGTERTLHLQVYMALDDEIGRAVEAALAAAASRGVAVRVLVDSLHGLHGSFGVKNPLFERLSAYPGIELRTVRPITELPSLADLKQRDHRKLVVSDGRLAIVGGRNLSHEYYTAFGEVQLTTGSPWRMVPWLDAGARVEGPAVAAISHSFLEAWTEAGGAPFDVLTPPPVGASAARVVVHRGLRDAHTLEAYLSLIETARSHVYTVNGFPLALEIQHALLRALRRGVRVRTLIGHLTPTHGSDPFSGAWSAARTAATELVHSRMDPIVAAGGEAYLFALRDEPGWAPGLGTVHPHVHAKAMSADGLRCAVGSANLDITASYWESELLLVAEEPALAQSFEARVDALMAGSTRVERDDPAWRQLSKRRSWMRYWPGVLSL